MATCNGCGESFPSRNAIFRHLKETNGACLSKEDYKQFVKYARKTTKAPKVIIMYGYLPYDGSSCSKSIMIRNGEDAGHILMETINELENEINGFSDDEDDNGDGENPNSSSSINNINRSYGYSARSAECVKQDEDTAAITEVMTARLYPLHKDMSMENWLDLVQKKLDDKFDEGHDNTMDDGNSFRVTPVRIIGRQDMPNLRFNAEMDITYRRVEYVLPVDFFSWSPRNAEFKEKIHETPIFKENPKHDIDHVKETTNPLDPATKAFMMELKNFFKLLTTRVVKLDVTDEASVLEKGFSAKKLMKRKRDKKQRDAEDNRDKCAGCSTSTNAQQKGLEGASSSVDFKDSRPTKKVKPTKKPKKTNVLKRKRYHNFTEKLMAHEYLTYRRLDRIYHRSTLKFPMESESKMKTTSYMILSMSGDMFLTGQTSRLIGVIVALGNGLIDREFIDCVFDENYPHLVPTPPAPHFGVVSSEVQYANQEGKTRRILSARMSDRYTEGWNNEATIRRVKDWQNEVYKYVDSKWKKDGRDEQGRLRSEQEWTEKVLLPWAEKAKEHLEDYKRWKKKQHQSSHDLSESSAKHDSHTESSYAPESSRIPQIEPIDPTVPEVYKDVLHHLRKLDASGEWPMTSSKRQLVMVSSSDGVKENGKGTESLALACLKAKRNELTGSSAYSFAEGQGGASGSFSVGIMPGGDKKQPKANSMFPDLVKAAFLLETKLFPDREPSSTIAVNRNAQFRPHTDSGAGAGQSTSLIVGLGTYGGGELMVEGDKHDIRYKAIEFDGWKQRHWTMPFKGERYSLVWFTPKGCEGMKGIELDL
ncbi:unnamed protein product [Pseudo-nitzschia multistriata]|uniref:Uncharacterized protein n=1 Tax=Pseudo-nitzschia multistriata TaxID=183589 RepID=A0A448ZRN1_9STRA|nr:unnamed protein product [Pseudo-nitzschia multistriata]